MPAARSSAFSVSATTSCDSRTTSAQLSASTNRDLAFYGAEDLTPSDFYTRHDAEQARARARRTVDLVRPFVAPPPDELDLEP